MHNAEVRRTLVSTLGVSLLAGLAWISRQPSTASSEPPVVEATSSARHPHLKVNRTSGGATAARPRSRTPRPKPPIVTVRRRATTPVGNPWPSFEQPAEGPAQAIGEYSKGCLRGGVKLPLDGNGYQVMRPSRRRFYGHPELVEFVQSLAAKAKRSVNTVLLIGDLAQPRGGRSKGGHSSHQTGLDVDIWFWHPPVARRSSLTRRQRERVPARSIVDAQRGRVLPRWKRQTSIVLRHASQDPRVARIFVHPIIKRELCRTRSRAERSAAAREQSAWLRKVRPWYGHDDHFHVRLHCPANSTQCRPQAPLPAGDGCDALGFWFDTKAQAERRKRLAIYRKSVVEGHGWPAACEPLLVR